MQRKLTITVDEVVYDGLYRVVGPRRISQFIENLVRPHVVEEDLSSAYAEMAAEEVREAEAKEWSESLLQDAADEARCGLVGQLRSVARRRDSEAAPGHHGEQ